MAVKLYTLIPVALFVYYACLVVAMDWAVFACEVAWEEDLELWSDSTQSTVWGLSIIAYNAAVYWFCKQCVALQPAADLAEEVPDYMYKDIHGILDETYPRKKKSSLDE